MTIKREAANSQNVLMISWIQIDRVQKISRCMQLSDLFHYYGLQKCLKTQRYKKYEVHSNSDTRTAGFHSGDSWIQQKIYGNSK